LLIRERKGKGRNNLLHELSIEYDPWCEAHARMLQCHLSLDSDHLEPEEFSISELMFCSFE
jgi:hypothetical protein